jgi:hypothetical protein
MAFLHSVSFEKTKPVKPFLVFASSLIFLCALCVNAFDAGFQTTVR